MRFCQLHIRTTKLVLSFEIIFSHKRVKDWFGTFASANGDMSNALKISSDVKTVTLLTVMSLKGPFRERNLKETFFAF